MNASSWTAGRVARFALLSLGAFIFIAPYLWMLSVALKPQDEIFSASLSLLPHRWALVENFTKALTRVPMGRILLNGVIVCGVILVLQLVTAIPCAYAMAKLRFRGAQAMVTMIMLGLLVPIHAIALPIYVALSATGTLNSYVALVSPFAI